MKYEPSFEKAEKLQQLKKAWMSSSSSTPSHQMSNSTLWLHLKWQNNELPTLPKWPFSWRPLFQNRLQRKSLHLKTLLTHLLSKHPSAQLKFRSTKTTNDSLYKLKQISYQKKVGTYILYWRKLMRGNNGVGRKVINAVQKDQRS